MARAIAFGGATDRAAQLRRQFLRGGGDPQALRFGEPEGAAVYVHVLGDEHEDWLRRARRARVRVVAVDGAESLEAVARAVAHRLDDGDGAPLAALLPILREPVCSRLVASAARRDALLAARGAGLPVLARNQLQLVRRIAQAHGEKTGVERIPELVAALGAGLACRALADKLREQTPAPSWAVKGAVAYAGTRAVGEAARKRFSLGRQASLPARFRLPRAAGVPVSP